MSKRKRKEEKGANMDAGAARLVAACVVACATIIGSACTTVSGMIGSTIIGSACGIVSEIIGC
jgi:hypothetical protein